MTVFNFVFQYLLLIRVFAELSYWLIWQTTLGHILRNWSTVAIKCTI